jgi:hypothetical protein
VRRIYEHEVLRHYHAVLIESGVDDSIAWHEGGSGTHV